jgi:hypothetical protein
MKFTNAKSFNKKHNYAFQYKQLLEVESPGDVGIFKPNSVSSCIFI